MDSVFPYFNVFTFSIQIILHLKIWFSCVMTLIVCDEGTKSWNFNSGRIVLNLRKSKLNYCYVCPEQEYTRVKRTCNFFNHSFLWRSSYCY